MRFEWEDLKERRSNISAQAPTTTTFIIASKDHHQVSYFQPCRSPPVLVKRWPWPLRGVKRHWGWDYYANPQPMRWRDGEGEGHSPLALVLRIWRGFYESVWIRRNKEWWGDHQRTANRNRHIPRRASIRSVYCTDRTCQLGARSRTIFREGSSHAYY